MKNLFVKAEIFICIKNADEAVRGFLWGINFEEIKPFNILDYLILEECAADSSKAKVSLV